MDKVKVARTIVEITGDEMAQVIWELVRERIIDPVLQIPLDSYDLSLPNRELTGDAVTSEAAAAILEHGVAVKCSTITPDKARAEEYGLTHLWRSPNGTLRKALDGVIFREPVIIESIEPLVPHWQAPIVIARHANADQYQATDFSVPGAGTLTLNYAPADGGETIIREVAEFGPDGGVALGMYNNTDSIATFARACFSFALNANYPVYLSTKNTVLKAYDGLFTEVFETVFAKEFSEAFAERELTYEHRLIDDMVAYAIKSSGGFLWALKNYDGDVQADIVAQGFGSPGLMGSVLATADGRIQLSEAAHGTVARHYRRHRAGDRVSTNPIATILAWGRALEHRAKLDEDAVLLAVAGDLRRAVAGTVDAGIVTDDLVSLSAVATTGSSTQEFIDAVASRFHRMVAGHRV
ncbi:NADP-dependent isocitrate dehydrogenase [Paeniglutamicibacter psychrophenolicus]|uniref:Isocitrate dehydrogenase [NADP] n=1 Tax=Paeniglutamicibacter psychrophenolicus TaxID=257454 RepID=A0ABS4WA89_9MICC|nr:NADP-dependent isocitrate dehydrogenase [Paeniglutamicibacter psychrophenolicus]MBP2373112.1 isocitrate dehydrogenase [Paeniglutamicibacter psychrophenolicus]